MQKILHLDKLERKGFEVAELRQQIIANAKSGNRDK
jgi:hypothetical protein